MDHKQSRERGRPYRLHAALRELAALDKSDFASALQQILKTSAKVLQVERVGLWFLRRSPLSIICQECYLLSQDAYQPNPTLLGSDYPQYFEALQKEEIITTYDAQTDPRTNELAPGYLSPTGIVSMMDIPIWMRGFLVGVLCHEHIGTRRRWTLGDQEFAFSIGQIITTALEAQERRKAEEAGQRSSFLARATALLSESLDVEAIPDRLARLVVPFLADWCVINIVIEGQIRRLAFAHADPAKEALLAGLDWLQPQSLESPYPFARILNTGEPILEPELSEEILRGYTKNEEQVQLALQLGMKTGLIVPIGEPGRVIGGLTLISSAPGRQYGPEDLELAQDLARRATNAIANARLYHQAKEAIRVRDEFLSIASHELYTPLTSLQLAIQSLRREKDAPSPEAVRKACDIAQRQIKRLIQLIEDLLDVSRIQAGRLPLRLAEVDLAEVVREAVEQLQQEQAQPEGMIQLNAPRPVIGRWDRARLEQIVTNLLSNALKFSAGKPVEISVQEGAEAALLLVRDQGIGISPEHLPYIFDRFERAVSARNYSGLGLGLYIVRNIVHAMGGSIQVESTLQQGSTFSVKLPLMHEAKNASPEEARV